MDDGYEGFNWNGYHVIHESRVTVWIEGGTAGTDAKEGVEHPSPSGEQVVADDSFSVVIDQEIPEEGTSNVEIVGRVEGDPEKTYFVGLEKVAGGGLYCYHTDELDENGDTIGYQHFVRVRGGEEFRVWFLPEHNGLRFGENVVRISARERLAEGYSKPVFEERTYHVFKSGRLSISSDTALVSGKRSPIIGMLDLPEDSDVNIDDITFEWDIKGVDEGRGFVHFGADPARREQEDVSLDVTNCIHRGDQPSNGEILQLVSKEELDDEESEDIHRELVFRESASGENGDWHGFKQESYMYLFLMKEILEKGHDENLIRNVLPRFYDFTLELGEDKPSYEFRVYNAPAIFEEDEDGDFKIGEKRYTLKERGKVTYE